MKQAVRAIVINGDKILVINRNKFGQKYATLPGGGVDMDETHEEALYREMSEETGVEIQNPRLVFIEPTDDIYGTQYVFLADYVSGEPALRPDSEEAKISAFGKNIYEPAWLATKDLPDTSFVSPKLKRELVKGLKDGFPKETIKLYD